METIVMDKITVTCHLDLIGHIKQYLDENNSSLFHKSDEISNIIIKQRRGEELTVDELVIIVRHQLLIDFKDNILQKDSVLLPDDNLSKDDAEYINEYYSEIGKYMLYESYYVMKFLDEAPEIINRASKLKKIFIKENPSERVREFCKEAYLAYINGLFTSSVVLLRSIIETILKEKLGPDIGGLLKINDFAMKEGLYGKDIWRKIDYIRVKVNKLIHRINRISATEEINRKMIIYSQDILNKLLN
jgi:hypothetical protein